MAAVIRRPPIGGEPVLLRVGRQPATPLARAAVPVAPPAAVVADPPGPLPSPPMHSPAPDLAELEREAHRRLAAEREQALLQATEAGRSAGLAAGQAAWAERIERLDRLLASLPEQLADGIAGEEDLLVELAFEAVVRILGQAAPTREGAQGLVREALASLREREQVVVRLAPPDVETLRAARSEMTRVAGCKGLEFVADERVELGGCLIETAGGGLDARLETQLQRLRELMLAARHGEDAA